MNNKISQSGCGLKLALNEIPSANLYHVAKIRIEVKYCGLFGNFNFMEDLKYWVWLRGSPSIIYGLTTCQK